MRRYADFISILASSEPLPSDIALAARSTVKYAIEQRLGLMPSFTLLPSGKDKSVISLHFPGWYFLGITPNLLMWVFGADTAGNGPRILPASVSFSR